MLTKCSQFLVASLSLSIFFHRLYKRNDLINILLRKDENFFLLLVISALTLFIVSTQSKERRLSPNVSLLTISIFVIFFILFLVNNIITFYIFFEISVVPLMLFIRYWGYRLERVKSLLYIFLYTFSMSFPFFIVINFIRKTSTYNILAPQDTLISLDLVLLLLASTFILVKVPIWMLHIWLIKAHVEASTEGSIILARVVLKLAGVAFIKLPLMFPGISINSNIITSTILTLSLTGAIIIAFYTIRQRDLKLIIAISSIIHIAFMILIYYTGHSISLWTLLIIIVAHGLISPLIFIFVGNIYDYISSRRRGIIKGALKRLTYVSIIWFFLTIFNIAVPLSINFIAEIYFFFNAMAYSYFLSVLGIVLIFINGLFNIYLYTSTASGQNKDYYYQTLTTEKTIFYYIVIFVVAVLIVLTN